MTRPKVDDLDTFLAVTIFDALCAADKRAFTLGDPAADKTVTLDGQFSVRVVTRRVRAALEKRGLLAL